MNNPICFALDGMNAAGAQRYVDMLEEHVGAYKVGLELFIRSRGLPKTNKPIVLDLKLHDIPETVVNAVKAGGDLGVKYMTLHVQQRAALEQAVTVAEPYGITLLGVTVLTSMTEPDLEDLGFKGSRPAARAALLAEFGYTCGLRGFVCSPQEVGGLRAAMPNNVFFLVPGIRPVGADLADQKRVGTPGQTTLDGANLLVIGRPIRDAKDPIQAVKSILHDVEIALSSQVV